MVALRGKARRHGGKRGNAETPKWGDQGTKGPFQGRLRDEGRMAGHRAFATAFGRRIEGDVAVEWPHTEHLFIRTWRVVGGRRARAARQLRVTNYKLRTGTRERHVGGGRQGIELGLHLLDHVGHADLGVEVAGFGPKVTGRFEVAVFPDQRARFRVSASPRDKPTGRR